MTTNDILNELDDALVAQVAAMSELARRTDVEIPAVSASPAGGKAQSLIDVINAHTSALTEICGKLTNK